MDLGVKGKITWKGGSMDFHYTTEQYKNLKSFPPSEGPRSIVEAGNAEHKAKYASAYADTDEFTSKLAIEKYPIDSEQYQLLYLTHVLTAARKESDRIMTCLLNGTTPQKRALTPVDFSDEDEEDERIKRQRIQDAQEIEADEECSGV